MAQAEVGGGRPVTRAKPVRVVIVDDSFLIRDGVQALLGLSDQVTVVGTCQTAHEAMRSLQASPPDVALLDVRLPPTYTDEGIRIAQWLGEAHPAVGAVVLSQEVHAELAAQLLARGASGRGYLLKDRVHDLDHLVSTILAVARGECRIDPSLVQQLVRSRRPESPLDQLTARQRQLLADVAEGKSNAAIARDRYLSTRAVEKHVSEIFARLGVAGDPDVSRRVRATLLYLEASR